MAKVSRIDGSKVRGKTNKKSDLVHRTRNGAEHQYTFHPYQGPASKAQKAHRKMFGKINAIVNVIMADPVQVKDYQAKMEAFNRTLVPYQPPYPKRFITVRQYIHHVISEQLAQQEPPKATAKATEKTPLPRGIKLYIKPFAELSAPEIYEILKSRFSVFVGEQGIRYLDEDDIDYTATHIALHRKGQVVAYARLFATTEPGIMQCGRMLTTEHGKGLGRILIMHVIAEAKRLGAHTLVLNAQTQAVPFYKHFRFKTVGKTFIEAEIPHIRMERKLVRAVANNCK